MNVRHRHEFWGSYKRLSRMGKPSAVTQAPEEVLEEELGLARLDVMAKEMQGAMAEGRAAKTAKAKAIPKKSNQAAAMPNDPKAPEKGWGTMCPGHNVVPGAHADK